MWVLTGFACYSARKSRSCHAGFRKCSYTCCARPCCCLPAACWKSWPSAWCPTPSAARRPWSWIPVCWEDEERCDHYEDIIGTYLVQLSSHSLSDGESQESTELLKTIGDFERISDHAVNVLESAEELQSKKLSFSPAAMAEYQTLARATRRILHLSLDSFRQDDPVQAAQVEPLEQVIDTLKEELRTRHILRMRRGQCSIEAGFVWADLLTDLERTSDHCSNVAGCVIDAGRHNLNLHETLRAAQTQDPDYAGRFRAYAQEYCLPEGE